MTTLADLPPELQAYISSLDPAAQADFLARATAEPSLVQIAQRKIVSNNLNGVAATLHQWAADARGTTVTAGNSVQVLQTIVNRLGTFFDRFADLLTSQGPG